MVSKARAGAFECIPYKHLTAEKLAQGIKQCLTDEARRNVIRIAESIATEGDGAINAVRSFHRSLPLRGDRSMRCSILENRVAVWEVRRTHLHLSALAADILVEKKKICWPDLQLIRHYDWNDFDGPGEPISAVSATIFGTVADAGKGVGAVPFKMVRTVRKRRRHDEKRRKWKEREKDTEQVAELGGERNSSIYDGHPPTQRRETELSALSADPPENLAEELVGKAAHGFAQTGVAIAKAPIDLSLAVAQGFHNAPRLYGDETVRKPVRISGFASGLRAGRDEFVYGIYDGFTGLVKQPYIGAKNKGFLGFVEGFGVGVGGFFFKNTAAVLGPLAYAAKGIQKEFAQSNEPTALIRKARIRQGVKELKALRIASEGKSHLDGSKEKVTDNVHLPREGETVDSIEKNVDHRWQVMLETLNATGKSKDQSVFRIKSRLSPQCKRMKWRQSTASKSVETVQKAQARKESNFFGESTQETQS
jgi:hypothetical protein